MGRRAEALHEAEVAASFPDVDAALAFDAAPHPYLLLDRNLVIVAANRAYLSTTGARREDLIGRHAFEVSEKANQHNIVGVSNLRTSLERAIKTRQPDPMPVQRYDLPLPDGSFAEHWWSPINVPVLDVAGEVVGVIHHAQDITDYMRSQPGETAEGSTETQLADASNRAARLEAELLASNQRLAESLEQLRASQERARLALEGVKDYAIFTTDIDGIITNWPKGCEAIFGWRADEIVGQSFELLFTPEDRAAGIPAQELAIACEEGCANDERWHIRKDGSRLFINGSVRPLHDADDRLAGFIKVGRDETRRRKIEAALHESGERYRLAAKATNDAIWDWDLKTGRIFWNEALHTLFGYDPATVDTTIDWWTSCLHPDDRVRVSSGLHAAISTAAQHWTDEYRFCRADGTYAAVLDRGAVIRDETGRAVRMVGAMHDLTDRKRAEAALRQLNDTLEQRVIEEVAARMKTEEALRQSQKMEAIGQLTGGVAHDFNNLLTIIRSSADLLRRQGLSDEKRRFYVEAISDTADRAAKLTGQLLAFARRQTLKPEVFDLGKRVDAVADMLRTVVGSRVAVSFDIRCGPCFVEADVNQFETALVNIAANARDAMSGEGKLSIKLVETQSVPAVRGHRAAKGDFIALSLTDTGVGITAENLPRIFEPFFTTKEVGKGTGLGLSQVYGFAKQSGGEVQVTSKAGRGTTITLYLPRSHAAATREGHAHAATSVSHGKGRVLVVEDNTAVGEFSTQLIDELGYEAVLAASADEALRMIEEAGDEFDVVFSDVVMPGMSGIELGREIRRRRPNLPIVLTSGYSHVLAEEGTHGFELLQKPYSVESLSRVLRRATRR